jgi:hypothetical protein
MESNQEEEKVSGFDPPENAKGAEGVGALTVKWE